MIIFFLFYCFNCSFGICESEYGMVVIDNELRLEVRSQNTFSASRFRAAAEISVSLSTIRRRLHETDLRGIKRFQHPRNCLFTHESKYTLYNYIYIFGHGSI